MDKKIKVLTNYLLTNKQWVDPLLEETAQGRQIEFFRRSLTIILFFSYQRFVKHIFQVGNVNILQVKMKFQSQPTSSQIPFCWSSSLSSFTGQVS